MDLRSKFVILMALAVLLTVSGADAMSANFGSELVVEPQIVVPNQRVTLTGRGFTSLVVPDGNGPSGVHQITGVGQSVITVGGTPLKPPFAFYPINFDDFGDWATTISIPVTDVTVAGGAITVRAVDDQGIAQTAQVIIGIPSITLEPETSRINTDVSVTGRGFPASNVLTRVNAQVPISYAGFALTVVSADDLGGFTATIRVPASTKISSNNIVRATLVGFDQWGLAVHSVPKPIITLSPSSGVPGTAVTVAGKGFPPNAVISSIRSGDINVLSSSAPVTDDDGNLLTFFTMPIFPPGTQTVAATADGLTGNGVFTIIEGAAVVQTLPSPPPSTLPADALASLTQGENLLRVWT
ncbi:MAG: hypothetical protein VX264_02175, partial [Chloroflexota bacterium]|nr:hypothetical protein [Chloroflexota bacterium]